MTGSSHKKFKVVTLGCRTNQYESAAYANQLKEMGYVEACDNEKADLCIVNTCTVTESADSSSRLEIRRLAKKYPESRIVVTGCLAERLPEEIARLDGVSQVIPNQKKEDLLKIVFPEEENLPEFQIDHFPAHTRAFVKVQDGCNSFCTYCIIPYVRGRSRSRPIPAIIREVEGLIENGYKEVVLTGINIGDFEGEHGERLADLVSLVDKIPGLKRLRLSSIDPDEVDAQLTRAIIEGKTTCHSLHLVLQSGSNLILKRMNRKYTRQIFLETVEKLQKIDPDFTFTTDLIVGFPGETEREFEETLQLMEQIQFAKVHMFPYSKRTRTRAALYTDQVPRDIITERKQLLLARAESGSYALRDKYIGRTLECLLETKNQEGDHSGHSDNFLPILLRGEYRSNDLVLVECVANSQEGLIGRCVL